MRVVVYGLGHQGAVTAACLAVAGHRVVGLDEDPARVAELADGRPREHEPGLPERLRDGPPADLRAAARRGRAAFGAKDSIADVLPWGEAMAFRDALDRLLKLLLRHEAAER